MMNPHPTKPARTLIHNIGELVTLAPIAQQKKLYGYVSDDLGLFKNAWLSIDQYGLVDGYGTNNPPSQQDYTHIIDAQNGLVLPGLIDCHTHPVFAGNRSHEFLLRLEGETYQSIARQGGGIAYTAQLTHKTRKESLLKSLIQRLARMLSYGITSIEAKSGYGLNVHDEIKLLEVLNDAKQFVPIGMHITYLGLHALPSGKDKPSYVSEACEVLARIRENNLAQFVDAFIEKGYFNEHDISKFFSRAQELDFGIRLHADQFHNMHGAQLAARFHALSADHLEMTDDSGAKALAESQTVAVLLPGTSLYTQLPFTQAQRFKRHHVPVAIASDYNPGSCAIMNLPLICSVAAVHCGLTPVEAIAAVTYVAARSLRIEDHKGTLAKGYQADFLLHHQVKSFADWLADFGQSQPQQVFVKGQAVYDNN